MSNIGEGEVLTSESINKQKKNILCNELAEIMAQVKSQSNSPPTGECSSEKVNNHVDSIGKAPEPSRGYLRKKETHYFLSFQRWNPNK